MEDKTVLIEREKILVPERSAEDDYSLMTTGSNLSVNQPMILFPYISINHWIPKMSESNVSHKTQVDLFKQLDLSNQQSRTPKIFSLPW